MERRLLTLLCWALSPAVLAQTVSTAPNLEIIPGIHDYVYVDQPPQCLNMETIRQEMGYPLAALKKRVDGRVFCRILIDEQGQYMRHAILRSNDPDLTMAVETHLHKLRFSPAVVNAQACKYWLNQVFDFKADGSARLSAMRQDNTTFLRRSMGHNRQEGLRLLQKGLGLLADQEYLLATNSLQNAIRLLPNTRRFNRKNSLTLFRAHLYTAQAEMALGNPIKASQHLTEAIGKGMDHKTRKTEWKRNLMQAYLLRSEAYLSMDMPLRALEDANWINAHIEEAEKAPLLVIMSRIYHKLGDFEQALAYAAYSVELKPEFAPAYIQKAELLLDLGAQEAACETIQLARTHCKSEADRLQWLELSLRSCRELSVFTQTQ